MKRKWHSCTLLCLAERQGAGKQKDLGSMQFRLSFLFNICGLWTLLLWLTLTPTTDDDVGLHVLGCRVDILGTHTYIHTSTIIGKLFSPLSIHRRNADVCVCGGDGVMLGKSPSSPNLLGFWSPARYSALSLLNQTTRALCRSVNTSHWHDLLIHHRPAAAVKSQREGSVCKLAVS